MKYKNIFIIILLIFLKLDNHHFAKNSFIKSPKLFKSNTNNCILTNDLPISTTSTLNSNFNLSNLNHQLFSSTILSLPFVVPKLDVTNFSNFYFKSNQNNLNNFSSFINNSNLESLSNNLSEFNKFMGQSQTSLFCSSTSPVLTSQIQTSISNIQMPSLNLFSKFYLPNSGLFQNLTKTSVSEDSVGTGLFFQSTPNDKKEFINKNKNFDKFNLNNNKTKIEFKENKNNEFPIDLSFKNRNGDDDDEDDELNGNNNRFILLKFFKYIINYL